MASVLKRLGIKVGDVDNSGVVMQAGKLSINEFIYQILNSYHLHSNEFAEIADKFRGHR